MKSRTMRARHRRELFSLVAASVLAGVLADAGQASAQDTPGVTSDTITLGGVLPLSGPVRLVGEPYQRGLQICFDAVTASGGVHGRAIKWLVEDDAYQPARSLAGAKRLVERDNVFMLVGQIGTPTTNAIVPYVEQAKVPFLSVVATKDKNRYTYGFMADYGSQIYEVVRYLAAEKGAKRFGFFYQNDDLGAAGRVGLERALEELGLPLAADVGYERGTTDFSTHILSLRDADVDAVISMSIAPSTATAIKQASAVNYTALWGTFSIAGGAAMQEMLGSSIDGIVFASEVMSQSSEEPVVQEVRALLQKSYPDAVLEWGVMIGCAQARLVARALEKAGPDITRESVVAALESPEGFDLEIMAPVSYGPEKRNAANAVAVFEWRDGKNVQVTDWSDLKSAGWMERDGGN